MNQSENNTSLLSLELHASRDGHKKPIFWLGAGCSFHDGVPLSNELLSQLVPATGFWGSPQYVFDQHFDRLSSVNRASELRRVMNKPLTADSPYHDLAYILRERYADLVFTFNIDHLLEDALISTGLIPETDYSVIDVPKTNAPYVASLVEQPFAPRIRIVKLHGDYRHGINYMTSREIAEYNPHIMELVQRYSRESAIVCGYSFFHLNVLTAFSRSGGPLYYANCAFPNAPMVLSLISLRSGSVIDGELGKFEVLMKSLRNSL
jgi:hypothetical protein